jgi:hypothetical protein
LDSSARILGALKLTGNLRPGTAIGLLSAYVDETSAVERVGTGNLAPRYEVPATPGTLYSAFRLRQSWRQRSAIGFLATSTLRNDAPGLDDAHVVAVDADARSAGDYTARGGTSWSVTRACDPRLTPGFHPGSTCDAAGAFLLAGKTGGIIRAYEDFGYTGADHDINDLGYEAHHVGDQNIAQTAHVGILRPALYGPWNLVSIDLSFGTAWNPNAGSPRYQIPLVDQRVVVDGLTRFRSNAEFGWTYTHNFERFDAAETRQNPLVRLYRRPETNTLWLRLRSIDTRPFWVQVHNLLDIQGDTITTAPGGEVNLLVGARLQLGATALYTKWFERPRWVDTGADGLPRFGALDLSQLELTLRATGAFSRDLTLQLFTQLLAAQQHYPRLYTLADPFTLLPYAGARGAYDQELASLIVNAVLRWEFRPGSTLFVAYTHNHQVTAQTDAVAALASGPADNVLAIKLAYLWGL